PYGIHTIPAAATNARRIEAGLLLAGTDFDSSVTPFDAGLGALVDLEKTDFIGKAALKRAQRSRRTWGLRCPDGIARHGDTIALEGNTLGRICSSAWSPYLECGVAIVRLDTSSTGPGTTVQVECTDGLTRPAEICELPMYDTAGDIPRGRRTDIPEIPVSR
ncbi:MAG: glycine cleavage T C-terminal barrel domain-containing protein, partial [Woeseiaceae bacterium]